MELIRNAYARTVSVLNLIAPLGDLAIRLWVAIVFFKSGLTKLDNWDGTRYLFQNEYHVPLLPPELAAYLGTATELFFPVLLAFGLATRFAAFVLFVFNIIAAASYPFLWTRRDRSVSTTTRPGDSCFWCPCSTERGRFRSIPFWKGNSHRDIDWSPSRSGAPPGR